MTDVDYQVALEIRDALTEVLARYERCADVHTTYWLRCLLGEGHDGEHMAHWSETRSLHWRYVPRVGL